MLNFKVEELQELASKIVKGPWVRHPNKERFWVGLPEDRVYTQEEHDNIAEFIVYFRNNIDEIIGKMKNTVEVIDGKIIQLPMVIYRFSFGAMIGQLPAPNSGWHYNYNGRWVGIYSTSKQAIEAMLSHMNINADDLFKLPVDKSVYDTLMGGHKNNI